MRRAVELDEALGRSVVAERSPMLSAMAAIAMAITMVVALICSPAKAYALSASFEPDLSGADVGYVAYHDASEAKNATIQSVSGPFTVSVSMSRAPSRATSSSS